MPHGCGSPSGRRSSLCSSERCRPVLLGDHGAVLGFKAESSLGSGVQCGLGAGFHLAWLGAISDTGMEFGGFWHRRPTPAVAPPAAEEQTLLGGAAVRGVSSSETGLPGWWLPPRRRQGPAAALLALSLQMVRPLGRVWWPSGSPWRAEMPRSLRWGSVHPECRWESEKTGVCSSKRAGPLSRRTPPWPRVGASKSVLAELTVGEGALCRSGPRPHDFT